MGKLASIHHFAHLTSNPDSSLKKHLTTAWLCLWNFLSAHVVWLPGWPLKDNFVSGRTQCVNVHNTCAAKSAVVPLPHLGDNVVQVDPLYRVSAAVTYWRWWSQLSDLWMACRKTWSSYFPTAFQPPHRLFPLNLLYASLSVSLCVSLSVYMFVCVCVYLYRYLSYLFVYVSCCCYFCCYYYYLFIHSYWTFI